MLETKLTPEGIRLTFPNTHDELFGFIRWTQGGYYFEATEINIGNPVLRASAKAAEYDALAWLEHLKARQVI